MIKMIHLTSLISSHIYLKFKHLISHYVTDSLYLRLKINYSHKKYGPVENKTDFICFV